MWYLDKEEVKLWKQLVAEGDTVRPNWQLLCNEFRLIDYFQLQKFDDDGMEVSFV